MARSALISLAFLALAACGGSFESMPRLSEVELSGDATASIAADPDAPGILDQAQGETAGAVAAEARPERPGFLGRLLSRRARSDGDDTVAGMAAEDADMAEPAAVQTASARRGGGGFLGLFGGGSGGAVDEDATGPVTFGEVRRACGTSRREMGKVVEKLGRYQLRDSDPGNAVLHPFYVTGFADNCPRKVMAAFGVFGDPAMHEVMRYSTEGDWGRVDNAYERVKGRVCGVRRGKPCGSNSARLARGTAFLTLYESFSGASRWTNVLLHDGGVEASEIRRP